MDKISNNQHLELQGKNLPSQSLISQMQSRNQVYCQLDLTDRETGSSGSQLEKESPMKQQQQQLNRQVSEKINEQKKFSSISNQGTSNNNIGTQKEQFQQQQQKTGMDGSQGQVLSRQYSEQIIKNMQTRLHLSPSSSIDGPKPLNQQLGIKMTKMQQNDQNISRLMSPQKYQVEKSQFVHHLNKSQSSSYLTNGTVNGNPTSTSITGKPGSQQISVAAKYSQQQPAKRSSINTYNKRVVELNLNNRSTLLSLNKQPGNISTNAATQSQNRTNQGHISSLGNNDSVLSNQPIMSSSGPSKKGSLSTTLNNETTKIGNIAANSGKVSALGSKKASITTIPESNKALLKRQTMSAQISLQVSPKATPSSQLTNPKLFNYSNLFSSPRLSSNVATNNTTINNQDRQCANINNSKNMVGAARGGTSLGISSLISATNNLMKSKQSLRKSSVKQKSNMLNKSDQLELRIPSRMPSGQQPEQNNTSLGDNTKKFISGTNSRLSQQPNTIQTCRSNSPKSSYYMLNNSKQQQQDNSSIHQNKGGRTLSQDKHKNLAIALQSSADNFEAIHQLKPCSSTKVIPSSINQKGFFDTKNQPSKFIGNTMARISSVAEIRGGTKNMNNNNKSINQDIKHVSNNLVVDQPISQEQSIISPKNTTRKDNTTIQNMHQTKVTKHFNYMMGGTRLTSQNNSGQVSSSKKEVNVLSFNSGAEQKHDLMVVNQKQQQQIVNNSNSGNINQNYQSNKNSSQFKSDDQNVDEEDIVDRGEDQEFGETGDNDNDNNNNDDDEMDYLSPQEKLWGIIESGQSSLDDIKQLLERSDVDVNAKNIFHDNWTALHYAVQAADLKVIQLLIDSYGAKIDIRTTYNKTPLHFACREGRLDIIKYLLEKGGSKSAQLIDRDGNSPLHYLCESENLEAIQMIMPYCSAIRDVRNKQGKRAQDLVASIEIRRIIRNYNTSSATGSSSGGGNMSNNKQYGINDRNSQSQSKGRQASNSTSRQALPAKGNKSNRDDVVTSLSREERINGNQKVIIHKIEGQFNMNGLPNSGGNFSSRLAQRFSNLNGGTSQQRKTLCFASKNSNIIPQTQSKNKQNIAYADSNNSKTNTFLNSSRQSEVVKPRMLQGGVQLGQDLNQRYSSIQAEFEQFTKKQQEEQKMKQVKNNNDKLTKPNYTKSSGNLSDKKISGTSKQQNMQHQEQESHIQPINTLKFPSSCKNINKPQMSRHMFAAPPTKICSEQQSPQSDNGSPIDHLDSPHQTKYPRIGKDELNLEGGSKVAGYCNLKQAKQVQETKTLHHGGKTVRQSLYNKNNKEQSVKQQDYYQQHTGSNAGKRSLFSAKSQSSLKSDKGKQVKNNSCNISGNVSKQQRINSLTQQIDKVINQSGKTTALQTNQTITARPHTQLAQQEQQNIPSDQQKGKQAIDINYNDYQQHQEYLDSNLDYEQNQQQQEKEQYTQSMENGANNQEEQESGQKRQDSSAINNEVGNIRASLQSEDNSNISQFSAPNTLAAAQSSFSEIQIQQQDLKQEPLRLKQNSEQQISNANPNNHENNGSDLSQAQNELIGPWSFIAHQLLGTGSFGEVYLVEKVTSGNYYAMKVLSKAKIMGNSLTRYALTERNVLSIANHPFVVKLNYAFQTDDKLFLILDYCPGGDLAEYIQLEKRFSEEKSKLYICEILLALEELHRKDIIFRDLKPDNIVLDQDGHALLTDFGLSKQGVMKEGMATSFCGSYAYLAPEMLKKTGHGKAVDWYLLGVVLYEMLCGIPPYYANNKQAYIITNKNYQYRDELFENIKRAPLIVPNFVSANAKNLIEQLLNRNPRRRLGTIRGADEIKKHPFFKDVDWRSVLQRKQKMPEPYLKKRFENFLELSPALIENSPAYEQLRKQAQERASLKAKNENKIEGWSFVSPQKNFIQQ